MVPLSLKEYNLSQPNHHQGKESNWDLFAKSMEVFQIRAQLKNLANLPNISANYSQTEKKTK